MFTVVTTNLPQSYCPLNIWKLILHVVFVSELTIWEKLKFQKVLIPGFSRILVCFKYFPGLKISGFKFQNFPRSVQPKPANTKIKTREFY